MQGAFAAAALSLLVVTFTSLKELNKASATVTQGQLLRHFTMRTIVSGGLVIAAAGAALLTRMDATSNYAAWLLPSMILMGIGIGSAGVVAIAMGQQGFEPRDAGTAGALNNVAQAAAVLAGALIRPGTRMHHTQADAAS